MNLSGVRRVLALGALSVALGAFGSCRLFDESLITDGPSNWSAVADRCPVPDSNLLNSGVRRHEGTVALNSLADDMQACGKLIGFDGPDGVIGVSLAAGEKLNITANLRNASSVPIDIGVYLMGACNPANCVKRVDRCPAGRGETLDFVTDKPGNYYIGFDSKAYDKTTLQPLVDVRVTFPRCGDGVVDNGETCDAPGSETCTSDCLARLLPSDLGVPEVEPNNDYPTANHVAVSPGKPFFVSGNIGGGCDLDFFAVDVPEGGYFLHATMLTGTGAECPAGTPPMVLEFAQLNGSLELGDGIVPAATTHRC